jgi:hypothetical protein
MSNPFNGLAVDFDNPEVCSEDSIFHDGSPVGQSLEEPEFETNRRYQRQGQ